jgi:hypothetical protein
LSGPLTGVSVIEIAGIGDVQPTRAPRFSRTPGVIAGEPPG